MTKLDINTITKVQYGKLSLEEDYIIMIECEECGNTEDTEEQICSECGNEDVIPTTNHEGVDCEVCGASIDMWEDALIGLGNNSGLICTNCMDELELKFN